MDTNRRIFLKTVSLGFGSLFSGCASVGRDTKKLIHLKKRVAEAEEIMRLNDIDLAKRNGKEIYDVGMKVVEFPLTRRKSKKESILKASVYYPIGKRESCPLIYFSHGVCKSSTGQKFLTEGAARRGQVVIAPEHHDFMSFYDINTPDSAFKFRIDRQRFFGGLIEILKNENVFSKGLYDQERVYKIFGDRLEEGRIMMENVEKRASEDEIFRNINFEKTSFGGYSLGGWVTLNLASEFNGKFKSVFAFSPASLWCSENIIKKNHAPILFMTGTYDSLRPDNAYEVANTPKYFISIREGGHIAFIDKGMFMGEGIPYWSRGENGVERIRELVYENNELENDFPPGLKYKKDYMNISGVIALGKHYPKQLNNYHRKALTISEGLHSFLGAYVDGNKKDLENLIAMKDNVFVEEFRMDS